jgi:hypothetical protein
MRFFVYLTVLTLFFLPDFIKSANAEMADYPIVKLQALDKSTARTVTFEAKVGTTIEYGSLFIKIQACRESDPLDKPESAAFLQIWEVPVNAKKSEWAFSGWMFASSPALSAMDHAVYDVWVLDCLDNKKPNKEAEESETKAEASGQEELAAPDEAEPVLDTQAPLVDEAISEEVLED